MTQQQNEVASSTGTRPDSGGPVWQLDPRATSVTFETKAMWFLKVHGTIPAVEGSAVVAEGAQGAEGRLVFDATRIDTGTAKRDAHLRTADFFDTEKYPTIVFVARSATPMGGRVDQDTVDVDGELTIADKTRPLAIRAEVRREGDVVIVTSTFTLDRRDWGLTWAKMGAGVVTRVQIEARFTREVSR